MKPIRLRLENLRSFHTGRTLLFDGLTIFGVTGNTGVGKTSVMEAMTYALFNRCTWHGGSVRELISKGAKAMTVELVFSVDGSEYTVMRRTTHNQSQARLQCAERGIDISNADAVTEEIKQALHMDGETFLHTVLLPQGKHAELLTKSNKERNDILKDLFRLKDLDQVLERAKRHEARANTELRMVRAQRQECGERPQETVAAAQAELNAASGELQLASKSVAREVKLVAESTEIQDGLKKRRDLIEILSSADEILAALAAIAKTAGEHEKRLAELHKEVESARKASEKANVDAKALRDAGKDADALRRIEATLVDLARELAAIEESRRREGSYQKSIEEHETELARARKALVTARDERKALSGKLAALQGEIGSRQRAREKLAVAIAVLEQTQASHGACAEAVNETTSRIEGLQKDLEAANEVAKKARETRDVASKKLERLKVDNQVAAIAGHLHAGEDCPVCHRSLPKNFKAPHSADLAKATKGLDEVRSALENAQRKANTIEGQLNELPARLTKDRKALTAAERVRKKAQSALEALLPSPGDKPEKVIAGHDRFLVKAEEGLRTWREDLTKRDGALSTLQTDETKALTNIEHCTRERGNCRRSIDAGVGKCEKLRAAVPEAYRPDDAGASLKNTIETVRKAIGQAEALRDRVGQATQSLATAGQALQTAEGAYGRDVREPRARTLERMKAIAKSANAPAAPNDEKKLDDWAQSIGDAATSLHRKLRDDIEAEEKRLRTLADAQTAIRRELGDLEPRIAENLATVAKTRAEEQVKIAQEKVMKAGEFDATIVRMEKIQMGLAGVKEALGGQKSAFPSYATQQRQQRLIEEANLILLEMTKGRFTFTSQFDILDSESNEERPSQTLSGGEKFLASLALSLGVVEIATNSGSRIESVFLDEGFDALDTQKLELAMLELRRRARAGRMIGVITHVHEVTKFLNDTILVTTTPEGSQFTHTGAVDEDDEKVEGLITHLTGDAAAI